MKRCFGIVEVDVDNQCVLLMSRDDEEIIVLIDLVDTEEIDWLKSALQKYFDKEWVLEQVVNWRVYGEVDLDKVTVLRLWRIDKEYVQKEE